MIAGSPWDEIKRVEQEGTANVDRIDAVLVELNAQLRALDARLAKMEAPLPKETTKRKTVQKKAEK